MQYELHITIPLLDAKRKEEKIQELIKSVGGWKTSEINRDPLLGEDTFFYLTKHSTDLLDLFQKMNYMVRALAYADIPVIREKIELIVYDTKQKKSAETGENHA